MKPDHVRHNRSFWDADSDAYQEAHGDALAHSPRAWGAYRVDEDELQVLGAVRDRDVLELGCGAAQWSIALAKDGARVVGLDVSHAQLLPARDASTSVPLALASGEQLPFAAASFDIVFCDHGAISFCDPDVIIPEAARIMRPGGLLAFCTTHPLLYLTWDQDAEKQTRSLQIEYEQLGRVPMLEGTIDWALSPTAWIRVLTRNSFDIQDCIELVASADAITSYQDYAPPKWARRWPAEWIWKARRR